MPVEPPNSNPIWRRNQVACGACHIRRVRCDLASPFPCSRCLRKGIDSGITRKLLKRGRMARSKLANANKAYGIDAPRSHIKERQTDESCSPVSQPTVSPMDSTILTPVTQPSSSGTDGIDTLLALCMEDYGSVTDFSQLQAGLGVDVTEVWLPTADLLKDLPRLSGEDDGPLPPLRDIRSSVDIAPHPPSQGPHPPTLCQPATNNLVPEDKPTSRPSMKYPVLNAVMPFLGTDLPPQLVCHLLELYFIGPFPNILRKASFLTDRFRVTSPALLASMLWMAAIDHRAYLSISPSQQRNICQFLGDLTRTLLQFSDNLSHENQEPSLVEHIAHLDNVITCIHIASIISTEHNAESMRW